MARISKSDLLDLEGVTMTKKVVRLGTFTPTWRKRPIDIFCSIEFENGRLSISGVEGPTRSGNCAGSCGQIDSHWRENVKNISPAPGWTHDMLAKFFAIWNRWHLNDMRAGSPDQEAYLREHKAEFPGYPTSYYDWACSVLKKVQLQPDSECTNDAGEPYSYGSAWLFEEVPDDVLDFLAALPDSDKKPAWV